MSNLIDVGPTPFPSLAPPDLLASAAIEASAILQTPIQMAYAITELAFTVACQGNIDVLSPDGTLDAINTSTAVVGDSGCGKTALFNKLLSVIFEYDAEQKKDDAARRAYHLVRTRLWKQKLAYLEGQISKRDGGDGPPSALQNIIERHIEEKPTFRNGHRFIIDDTTKRAVFDRIEGDGQSVVICSDDWHPDNRADPIHEIGLYNKLHDSPAVLNLDRANGKSALSTNPRGSILYMFQPVEVGFFSEAKGGRVRASGLPARFNFIGPLSFTGCRQFPAHKADWVQVNALHDRMREELQHYRAMVNSGTITRKVIPFSDEAKLVWSRLSMEFESLMAPGQYLADIRDAGSKAMRKVRRRAALYQYASDRGTCISRDNLERAAAVERWMLSEFKRLFAGPSREWVQANLLIPHMRLFWGGLGSRSKLPKNDLLQTSPVRTKDELDPALRVMVGWNAVHVGVEQGSKQKFVFLHDDFFAAVPPPI